MLKRGIRLHKKTQVCVHNWNYLMNIASIEQMFIRMVLLYYKMSYFSSGKLVTIEFFFILWHVNIFFEFCFLWVLRSFRYVSKYSIWERITHITVLEGYFETLNGELGFWFIGGVCFTLKEAWRLTLTLTLSKGVKYIFQIRILHEHVQRQLTFVPQWQSLAPRYNSSICAMHSLTKLCRFPKRVFTSPVTQ